MPNVDEVIRVAHLVLDDVRDPELREMFLSDPGGVMAYQGYLDDADLTEDEKDAVARQVIDGVKVLLCPNS